MKTMFVLLFAADIVSLETQLTIDCMLFVGRAAMGLAGTIVQGAQSLKHDLDD